MTAARPLALALAAALISGSASAAPRQRTKAPAAVAPTTALQLVRRLLGIPQRVAVGGSRSSGALNVCLISPALTTPSSVAGGESRAVAITPLAAPTLLAATDLSELRLERGDEVLWRQRASSDVPIRGPIAWPIAPMQPGETLRLRLRPWGASGADFAAITIQAASAPQLERYQQLLDQLGRQGDPVRWSQAIEQVATTNPSLAIALLTSPQAPPALQPAAASLRCQPPAPP